MRNNIQHIKPSHIWAAIDEIAKLKGVTTYTLAKMAGLSDSTLKVSKRGEKLPTLETIISILKATDISLQTFTDTVDWKICESQKPELKITPEPKYFIISVKHTRKEEKFITLWRAESCGYTLDVNQAGLYSEQQIKQQFPPKRYAETFPVLSTDLIRFSEMLKTPNDPGWNGLWIIPNTKGMIARLRKMAPL